jgi:hypothetical protein
LWEVTIRKRSQNKSSAEDEEIPREALPPPVLFQKSMPVRAWDLLELEQGTQFLPVLPSRVLARRIFSGWAVTTA